MDPHSGRREGQRVGAGAGEVVAVEEEEEDGHNEGWWAGDHNGLDA